MAEPITVTITNLNSPIRTAKVSNKVAESAVTSVAGRVGDVLLTQSDVAGLENVNNTSDLNKPISTATQAALDANGNGDMLASNNLSDVTNAATSRTNLGLAIGTDVQAHSAVLDNTTASFTTADETRLNDQVITDVIDKLSWNATDLTFDIETGIGVVIQIGEELLVKVRNKTGVTIFNGSVVKINGASGSRPTVELAQSDSLANIDGVIGIVTADILNNQVGFATVHGLVRDLNTSAFNEGDEIFLSDSVAGGITNVEPPLSVPVGTVTYSNPTNGTVFANVDNQKHLLEFANDPTLVGSFSPSGWKTGLGLENVDNTSDLNKPVSTATQLAIDNTTGNSAPIVHQHLLADITDAGTAAAANVGDFATFSHQHLLVDITNAGTAAASNVGDFATFAQGQKADSAIQSGNIDTLAKINSILTTPDLIDTSDSRLTDSRTPFSHASSHTNGTDDIQDATVSQKGLATALQIQKLDSVQSGANITDSTNVSGAGAQMISQKGVAGGYAGLDGGGKVPSAQLPSYVDDILEYPNLASFPNPGEFGKLYVALDTNKIYRWSGSAYIEVSNGSTGPLVTSVNTLIGDVVLDPDDLDDSSTTNKFTNTSDISKLSGIAAGAEVNVNADWNANGNDAEIFNKPTFGTIVSFDSGDYSLSGHQHILADITNAGTMASADTGNYALTGHNHQISDVAGLGTIATYNSGDYALFSHTHSSSEIFGFGTSADYDVNGVGGDAGEDEVVLGNDSRLNLAESLGSAAYFDVNLIGDATSTQVVRGNDSRLSLAAGSIQSGDNVSLLVNDTGYLLSGDNISVLNNNSLYVASGDNVSDLINDAGYITSAGAPAFSYRSETGDYTVVGADYTIDCISGNQTITMLDATSASGQIFVVKNSSPGVITITGTSSQTFDGNASVETDFPQSLTLQSTNINWIII